MRVLLVSTYELGHQPLHLAVPAAALLRDGHDVRCVDAALGPVPDADVAWADAMALSVPMHTAMRLARQVVAGVRHRHPDLPVCVYGLYATVGCPGAGRAIAGEYLSELLVWAADPHGAGTGRPAPLIRRGRDGQPLPARHLLPGLEHYARVVAGGEERLVGYVEASRGCAHRCRHCPVPVVYDGRTRLVDVDTLLADVDQLVAMGAAHITFGDPDFLNGPHHASRVLGAVHTAFPHLTFDVTVKVEHILRHRDRWAGFADAGCLFVTTAAESAEDVVLARLAKGHTVADVVEAVGVLRRVGIEPRPSLVPFTPWTTPDGLAALLQLVVRADLVGNVDPVQMGIRLLLPPGSLLLDDPDLRAHLDGYDDEALGWQWRSEDGRLDALQRRLAGLAEEAAAGSWPAERAHRAIRRVVADGLGRPDLNRPPTPEPTLRSPHPPADRPRTTEPWFCCAEPTAEQRHTAGDRAVMAGPAPR